MRDGFESYRAELDGLRLTEESRERLADRLTGRRSLEADRRSHRPGGRLGRAAVIAAAGIFGGVLLALFHGRFVDAAGRAVLVTVMSVPGFCLAYFLIWLFAQKLRVLPSSGAEGPLHFVLPCLAVSAASACAAARLLRASLLGELGRNYILTARAKGLGRGRLLDLLRGGVLVRLLCHCPFPPIFSSDIGCC